MSTRNVVAPEVLGSRNDLPHNRYVHEREALSLTDVAVTHGTAKRSHGIVAPSGQGETSRRLRRFALALSRVKFPEVRKYAKRWGVSERAIDLASQLIAYDLYSRAYSDDPTDGTMSVAPLARLLNEPAPNVSVFREALGFANTKAFETLLSVVPLEIADHLKEAARSISMEINYERHRYPWIHRTESRYHVKWGRRAYRDLASRIDDKAQEISNHLAESNAQAKQVRRTEELAKEYGNGQPVETKGLTGWYPLFVSKPPLDLPHTGKLGRKVIYTNQGKHVKNIGRLVTDPERRIFTRKTRSLGAVVIVDCSGSMSLTDDELKAIMKASAGATVLAYSTGGMPSKTDPNAWIVARKGRQVRHMPNFPGGNGCDGPALAYGVSLRAKTIQPVIWISDGRVTGIADRYSPDLADQCRRLCKKHGIIHVRNVKQAIAQLKKLQGGK